MKTDVTQTGLLSLNYRPEHRMEVLSMAGTPDHQFAAPQLLQFLSACVIHKL